MQIKQTKQQQNCSDASIPTSHLYGPLTIILADVAAGEPG